MPDFDPVLTFRGDPRRVQWSERDRDTCSYCGAAIPDESVRLRLFKSIPDATVGVLGCVFCDRCAAECFGIQRVTWKGSSTTQPE